MKLKNYSKIFISPRGLIFRAPKTGLLCSLAVVLLLSFITFAVAGGPRVEALCPAGDSCPTPGKTTPPPKTPAPKTPPAGSCESADANVGCTDSAAAAGSCSADANCSKIYQYLDDFINLISAAVGIAAVGMMIYGGIEFSSSGGDPQGVANAKKHITNALIALVAFIFLWAFLNFIIPGGILNASKPS